MTASPLRQLAERMGIIREYLDQTGTELRETSDDTRIALLAAMGLDASSDAAASRELDQLETLERERMLEPVRVVRADSGDRHLARVHVPGGSARVEWRTELLLEGGDTRTDAGTAIASRDHADLPIAAPLLPGYHRLRVSLSAGGEARQAEQSLIITPFRCPDPAELGGGVFGITANLYTLRGRRNWGAGDMGDLAMLAEWSGSVGAHFVGVNPLHALHNRGGDISPYSPISRLFRNVLYLEMEAIPDLVECAAARELLSSPGFQSELARLRDSGDVEYERVMALKRPLLDLLHRSFIEGHRDRGTARGERYRSYVTSQGEALQNFATWMALHEHVKSQAGEGNGQGWPAAFRQPRSRAVLEFRDANADAVDFHRYLQFELDRQLADVAARAKRAGHRIGIYQDLAIGSAPGGSDVWAFPDLFIRGAAIGAPPDPLCESGQNWGLPPLDPRQLTHHGYDYWIRLLRASLANAGALRIDHVMGLFRQFWIPEGLTGREGAYVRFPSSDLLGILALEATRHGAFVVGEDLGTVPPDVPPALAERNILSSRVLYFERDGAAFTPASRYPRLALATANTHDMTTLAGFWSGRDIELCQATSPETSRSEARREQALETREQEKKELLARLVADGALNPASTPPPIAELCGAVHDFLCRTPSEMVGLSLDDIAGEVEPVNMPGVPAEGYRSWTRRMHLAVEELWSDPGVRIALGSCASARRLPDG
ncbi:MAG: 4-alpha-glucanotransferase [Gemmatimonadota bacterium]|nr:4-alpha-glucanotransferase [Gemmatimonadota bacterium]